MRLVVKMGKKLCKKKKFKGLWFLEFILQMIILVEFVGCFIDGNIWLIKVERSY